VRHGPPASWLIPQEASSAAHPGGLSTPAILALRGTARSRRLARNLGWRGHDRNRRRRDRRALGDRRGPPGGLLRLDGVLLAPEAISEQQHEHQDARRGHGHVGKAHDRGVTRFAQAGSREL
jgi:hypothetical protein